MMRVFVCLLLAWCLLAPAHAEEPVFFPDPALQAAVERTLLLYDPTPTDMLGLIELDNSQSFTTQNSGISELTGLEHAVNLQTLNLRLNLISDAGPLSALHNLEHLNLSQNRISDLSPLAGLTRLRYLNLHANRFTDVSSLSALENLEYLSLHTNRVEDISPLAGLSALQTLVLRWNRVVDLSALSGLANLEELDLHANRLRDLSPLAGLAQLSHLDAGLNSIEDISPLAGLSDITTLYLGKTNIREITPLLGLTNLKRLNLEDIGLLYNEVYCSQLPSLLENTSGLLLEYTPNHRAPTGLHASDGTYADKVRLAWDYVCNGPHYTSYYRVYRALTTTGPKIPLADWQTSLTFDDKTADPGVTYTYWVQTAVSSDGLGAGSYSDAESGWSSTEPTSSREYKVSISSTTGGSVAEPGEGTFIYEEGKSVKLQARANDDFVFVKWSGVAGADQNPTWLTVTENRDIQACFASTLAVIRVDDDAPADPAPGASDRSDPAEDGTPDHPFDSIQEAIEVAAHGAQILVRPGTYYENIDLLGKRIALFGVDDKDRAGFACPVIYGAGTGPVVTFAGGEDPNCLLTGFVLTGGQGGSAGAIRCAGSSPTIANCLIVGNRATAVNGAAVHCTDSNAVFVNCTIADNAGGQDGAGLFLEDGSVIVTSSILWGNTPGEVLVAGMGTPSILYSNVGGGWPGEGNIAADPLFVRPGAWDPNGTPYDSTDDFWLEGDYHLQSQAGRWDVQTQGWYQDELTSPCIDAGDPASPINDEPVPHGGVVNAGAYGGTAHASRTPHTSAQTEEPVHFPDPILKEALELALWVQDPTPTDMLALTNFICTDRAVTDIRGLEYAVNLQELSLRWNEIRDLSPLSGLIHLEKLNLSRNRASNPAPLAGLTNLRHLDYHDNGISDISSLAGLNRLQTLILHANEISDVSALAAMTDMRELDLFSNRISDVSPLLSLTRLEQLDLRVNPLSDASCEVYIPQIIANNPGMDFNDDVCVSRSVSITSTLGGSVADPGEGTFTYQNGELVRLEAQADTGYTFVRWSGSYSTTENPAILVVNQDHQIQAEFVSLGI